MCLHQLHETTVNKVLLWGLCTYRAGCMQYRHAYWHDNAMMAVSTQDVMRRASSRFAVYLAPRVLQGQLEIQAGWVMVLSAWASGH